MYRLPLLIVCLPALIFTARVCSQVTDDFSGDHLTWRNSWLGDTAQFMINNAQVLQLQGDDSGPAMIFLEHDLGDSTVWEIDFFLDFSPSGSNRFRLYAGLDTPALNVADGYFFELGESGSDDAMQLYGIADGDTELLALTGSGNLSDEPVSGRLRAMYSIENGWEYCLQYGTDMPWLDCIAIGEDWQIPDKAWFGIQCYYTSSRKDRFFFDNLYIGQAIPDTTGPVCISLEIIDSTLIELVFDEILDTALLLENAEWHLNPANTEVTFIEILPLGFRVRLHFDTPFENLRTYCLDMAGIRDVHGNAQSEQQFCFEYVRTESAGPFELLITEIMADPQPPLGLPAYEYLELHNASGKALQLEDYTLFSGSRQYQLNPMILRPGDYLILCKMEEQEAFMPFGASMGLPDFPSLPNKGARIGIRNANEELIYAVDYTDAWYHDPSKSEGGWALEMQNIDLPCLLGENWRASQDLTGGTPGRENAVTHGMPIPEQPLDVVSVIPISNQSIRMTYNQSIWPVAGDLDISMVPGITVDGTGVYLNDLFVHLDSPMDPSVEYSITVEGLMDCLGKPAEREFTMSFSIPAQPQPGELIVNEILFYSNSGGTRFVEIYNTSEKYFLSTDLVVGEIDEIKQDLHTIADTLLITPGMLLVLTPDPGKLTAFYTVENPDWVLPGSVPSWNSEGGQITLLRKDGGLLESFVFSEEMHHPIVDNPRGISLERISPLASAVQASSWQSCSADAGYATPTAGNSQSRMGSGEGIIAIENRTFSPDGDGYRDALYLDFGEELRGFVANVRVFDMSGSEIDRLLQNAVLPAHLTLDWHGTDRDGVSLPIGRYIVWVECFHPDGRTFVRKETCTLAARL